MTFLTYSPDAIHGFDALHPELLRLSLQHALRVNVGDLARFAHQRRVLQLMAADFVVQTFEAMQEGAVGKSER